MNDELLEWKFSYKSMTKNLNNRKVVIWGIANDSALLYDWAMSNGIEVECFIDQQFKNYPNGFRGLPVNNPDNYLNHKNQYFLWLCMGFYDSLQDKLNSMDWKELIDYIYLARIKRISSRYNVHKHEIYDDIYLEYIKKEISNRENDGSVTDKNCRSHSNIFQIGSSNIVSISEAAVINDSAQIILKDGAELVIKENSIINGKIVVADGSKVTLDKNCKLSKNSTIFCIHGSILEVCPNVKIKGKSRLFIDNKSSVSLEQKVRILSSLLEIQINSRLNLHRGVVVQKGCNLCVHKDSLISIGYATNIGRDGVVFSHAQSSVVLEENCMIKDRVILKCVENSSLLMKKYTYTDFQCVFFAKYNSSINLGRHMVCQWGMLCNVGYNSTLDIGDFARFNRDTTIISGNSHPIFSIEQENQEYICNAHIKIGKEVWAGRGAMFYSGADVGNGCVIGVYSMVNRKIPNNCMIMGNPARIIRRNIFRGMADTPYSMDSKKYNNNWINQKNESEEKEDE